METKLHDCIIELVNEINAVRKVMGSEEVTDSRIYVPTEIGALADSIDSLMSAYIGLKMMKHEMTPEWERGE